MSPEKPASGSALGRAELHRVEVRGHDLTGELLGRVGYTDMVALMLLDRLPGPAERRMLDALLVVLVEHGMVKSAVVGRFVYSNAPESLQAAVAAGLLGAGSKHLGSSEWCARMLQEALPAEPADARPRTRADAGAVEAAAARVVAEHAQRRERIPGIGHRTHAEGDPRAARLFEIAHETGVYGVHCALLERLAAVAGERAGRLLPVNVTGAIAAVASDMGFRWQITRAFALLGRALGTLAHVQEEMVEPLADRLLEQAREGLDDPAPGP